MKCTSKADKTAKNGWCVRNINVCGKAMSFTLHFFGSHKVLIKRVGSPEQPMKCVLGATSLADICKIALQKWIYGEPCDGGLCGHLVKIPLICCSKYQFHLHGRKHYLNTV